MALKNQDIRFSFSGIFFSWILLTLFFITIIPWNNIVGPIEGVIFQRGKIADFMLPTVPCFFEAKSNFNSLDAPSNLKKAYDQLSTGLPVYNKGGISILITDERCLYVQWINLA